MSFILPFHTFHTFYTFIHSISTESTVLSSILIFLLMVMSLDFHATIREPRNGLLVLLLVTIFAILAWYSLFPQPVCQFSFVLLFIFFHLSAHLVWSNKNFSNWVKAGLEWYHENCQGDRGETGSIAILIIFFFFRPIAIFIHQLEFEEEVPPRCCQTHEGKGGFTVWGLRLWCPQGNWYPPVSIFFCFLFFPQESTQQQTTNNKQQTTNNKQQTTNHKPQGHTHRYSPHLQARPSQDPYLCREEKVVSRSIATFDPVSKRTPLLRDVPKISVQLFFVQ